MRTWSLAEEIYRALHDWPKIAAFFLAGCLIGWLVSLAIPGPYRAAMKLYVGLNPYRAQEDAKFLSSVAPRYSNLDDYKNWQMSQLNAALFLEDSIQETLQALRQQNPAWENVSEDELRRMLRTEWRTAGEWELVAEHRQEELATQAAASWGKIGMSRLEVAVDSARELIRIDQQSGAVAEQIASNQSRLEQIAAGQLKLKEWLVSLGAAPQNQMLEETQRWQILGLVSALATFEPAWMRLLDEQPGAESLPGDYEEWVQQVLVLIDQEIPILEQSIDGLYQKLASLQKQYAAQSDLSLGLSPNLEIQSMALDAANRVRPTGVWALLGGILGLGTWVLVELVRITRRVDARNG